MSRRALLLTVCVALTACLATRDAAGQRYFPLTLGDAWVYNVTLDEKPARQVLQVLVSDVLDDPSGQIFVVSELDGSLEPNNRPDHPITYQLREGGIFSQESEAYVLPKSPSKGQTWPAGPSETEGLNRIVSMDASLEAVGRQFKNCLIVDRMEPRKDRRIELVFAPEVGLVRARFFRLSRPSGTSPYREEILVEFGRIVPPRFLRPPK